MAFREGKAQTTCSSHGPKGIWAGNDHVKSSPAVTARWIKPSHAQTSWASWRLGPNPITSTRCWAPLGPLLPQQEFVRSLTANVCLWSFPGRSRVPEIEGSSAYGGSFLPLPPAWLPCPWSPPGACCLCSLPWHVAALPAPAGFCLVSVCLGLTQEGKQCWGPWTPLWSLLWCHLAKVPRTMSIPLVSALSVASLGSPGSSFLSLLCSLGSPGASLLSLLSVSPLWVPQNLKHPSSLCFDVTFLRPPELQASLWSLLWCHLSGSPVWLCQPGASAQSCSLFLHKCCCPSKSQPALLASVSPLFWGGFLVGFPGAIPAAWSTVWLFSKIPPQKAPSRFRGVS